MQDIVFEKPYKFIPPHRGTWWPEFIQHFNILRRYLRKSFGVVEHECRNIERLRESIEQGYGVLMAPNHARPCDPLTLGFLIKQVPCLTYAMASWHLFQQDWFTGFAIRRMGGFSVYREGLDREAINTAVDVLVEAKRPLLIFPEGAVFRTNDVLHPLLDGVAFIARTAAKRRLKKGLDRGVVVHPIALKYYFQGDVQRAVSPVLEEIEGRFTWRNQSHLPLLDRIYKTGMSLLALKELEYMGQPQSGALAERLDGLIDQLLTPLEEEWLTGRKTGPIIQRVKALRTAILPDMIWDKIDETERQRRWHQLEDIYLAQQVAAYVPDYITNNITVDRLVETVERYEEDLTDSLRVIGDYKLVIDVGEAIPVDPQRDRKAAVDPLMSTMEANLQGMLNALAMESPKYEG